MSANFKAGRLYAVRITRPIPRGVFTLLPRDEHQISGEVLNEIVLEHGADVVESATRATAPADVTAMAEVDANG